MTADRQSTDAAVEQPVALHGCALLLGELGILVLGAARSGKSSLCLSTLRRADSLDLPARLVADDRVRLGPGPDGPLLLAPERLFGRIEVSGVGILKQAAVETAPLRLVVELCDPAAIERLPDDPRVNYLGSPIRRVRLPERQSAFGADVLVSLALDLAMGGGRN